jgi:D-serine deaminase-like pyridoxal phosphate-dependent protein
LPSPVGDLALTGTEGAGEVQTPVRGRHVPALGERVWMRHAKAGELAEHVTTYHLIAGDHVAASVPTYRGEGRAFG